MLFVSLPFYFSELQRWSLVAFFVIAVVRLLCDIPSIRLEWNRQRSVYLCLLLLFALLLCFRPIESDASYWPMLLEQRLPYLGFGLIGLLGLQTRVHAKFFSYTGLALILGITVYLLCCLPWHLVDDWSSFQFHFNELRHTTINAHMAYNLFLSAVMLLQVYQFDTARTQLRKAGILAAILLIYLIMVISDGRIGLIAANLILLVAAVRIFKIHYRVLAMILPVALALLAATLLLHPKFSTTFSASQNPRIAIWKLSLHEIAEHPWRGYGPSSTIAKLAKDIPDDEGIKASGEEFLLQTIESGETFGIHPHSMYLQVWMEYGVVGVAVLLSLVILAFAAIRGKGQALLATTFWSIICLQMLTDIVHSAIGETAFCLYLYLLMQLPSKEGAPDDSQPNKQLA